MKTLVVIFCLYASSAFADPDLQWVLKLTGNGGLAHACPVSMGTALTNAHVIGMGGQLIWGVNDGEAFHGLVEGEGQVSYRDLARVHPVTEMQFPHWYPIAEKAPQVGEKVYFVGYEWGNRKDAFSPHIFKSTITEVLNGHIAFAVAGKPGSSGSCILNEQGEVVAINQGGVETENNNGVAGLGVGVWGDWLRLSPDPKPTAEPCTANWYAVAQ